MKKAKKAKKAATAAPTREVSIAFVGSVIDRAVAELEEQRARMPRTSVKAHLVVKSVIGTLKFTAKTAKIHCENWFMP